MEAFSVKELIAALSTVRDENALVYICTTEGNYRRVVDVAFYGGPGDCHVELDTLPELQSPM